MPLDGHARRGAAGVRGPEWADEHRRAVHLREQLSNLAALVVRLFESLSPGIFKAVLAIEPGGSAGPKSNCHKRLSSKEVDQLVRDYCLGAGSVYELAAQWRVLRSTIAKHLRDRGLELGKAQLSSDESARAVEL